MKKFKIVVIQNRLIQFLKFEKEKIIKPGDFYNSPVYNIYINGKCFSDSFFSFYFDLEIVEILNAKQLFLKQFKN